MPILSSESQKGIDLMTPKEIVDLRKRLRWSQARLAQYFDTDKGTISRWERGVNAPSRPFVKMLDRLAKRK